MTALATCHLLPPPAISPEWALFLDVDGCLLDFADQPEAVQVPDGLCDELMRLREALGGAVAFVSGRSIAQLDALFAPVCLPCAGLHGLEVREFGAPEHSPAERPAELERVREAATRVVRDHPGARIEDKGIALALHWRAEPGARSALEAIAAAAVHRLPDYRLQHGNCVVELRPAQGDKGTAVERLMGIAPFAGRRPVFAGDDFTDEDGFAAVNRAGGLSIIVGDRRPTAARHALADTATLRAWLADGARRLGAPA
jgi:trehalose 6-phosphate phosphatase